MSSNNVGAAPPRHGARSHVTRQMVREGHMMRNLVRNMVVNMECVLNDLRGIMGEIQSLVVQIDSVTDRIDKQCKGGPAPTSPPMNQRTLRGGGAAFVRQQTLSEAKKDEKDTQGKPNQHCLNSQVSGRDNAQRIKKQTNVEEWLLRGSSPQSRRETFHSPSAQSRRPYNKIESATRDTKKLLMGENYAISPRRMKKAVFVKREAPGVSGKKSKTFEPVKQDTLILPSMNLVIGSGSTEMTVSPAPTHRKNDNSPEAKEAEHSRILVSRKLSVSRENKSKPPVTVKQPLPSIDAEPGGHKKSFLQHNLNKGSVSVGVAATDSAPPSASRTKKGSDNKVSEAPQSRPHQVSYEFVPPAPSQAKTCVYQSFESDLDSDAMNEYGDVRSVTPDIDWSYLNLVGDEASRANIPAPTDVNERGRSKKKRAPKFNISQSPFAFQTSPDIVFKLPAFGYGNSTSPRLWSGKFRSNSQNCLENVLCSAVVTHVFCKEVESPENGNYCGCYEAIVDSVLENISGFDSFDDACAEVDNLEEVIEETYVSFDDEFEEDGWGIGLEHEDNFDMANAFSIDLSDPFDNNSFSLGIKEKHSVIFGRLNFSTSNTFPPTDELEFVTNDDIVEDDESISTDQRKSIKRKLSPVNQDTNAFQKDVIQYDDVDFRFSGMTSFTDEDCCALKPNTSNSDPNFSLWTKPLLPHKRGQENDNGILESTTSLGAESQMTSSDEGSCRAMGSGSGSSNMSFGSAELNMTSPEVDLFMTSSDADDLFTSRDEDGFVLPENNVNRTTPEAGTSGQKAKTKQLRREFFESLYSVCDGNEGQSKQEPDRELTESSEEHFRAVQNNGTVDNQSDSGSYLEDVMSYNRNVNTWTAYAMVHVQADDVSDSASDIFNDNSVNCSLTSSYLDADNSGVVQAN